MIGWLLQKLAQPFGPQPAPRYTARQVAAANPPPGSDADGWRCADCRAPSYAFGHLHPDGWHDAVPPKPQRKDRTCSTPH